MNHFLPFNVSEKEILSFEKTRQITINHSAFTHSSSFMLREVQNKDEIIQRIKTPEIKGYLKENGIKHLRLFGSFATGEQTSSSDVDFLYEEEPKAKIGRELFFLMDYLKQKMGRKVDMVGKDFVNHRIKKYVLSEKVSII